MIATQVGQTLEIKMCNHIELFYKTAQATTQTIELIMMSIYYDACFSF